MALITKPVKVSNKVEARVAEKLDVDEAKFKRVKFVNPNMFRFSFFIFDKGVMLGTLNYFWDIRKNQQIIYLKRFSDDKIERIRHLNEPRVKKFFNMGEE